MERLDTGQLLGVVELPQAAGALTVRALPSGEVATPQAGESGATESTFELGSGDYLIESGWQE